jgi:hypothetical protein
VVTDALVAADPALAVGPSAVRHPAVVANALPRIDTVRGISLSRFTPGRAVMTGVAVPLRQSHGSATFPYLRAG